ncbi:MAG: AAA family ATPase [Saccharofermentans sp.]|nr:AAA family ATPase [Saccharofermentans sp.]
MFNIENLNTYIRDVDLSAPQMMSVYQKIIEDVFKMFNVEISVVDSCYISEALIYEISIEEGKKVSSIRGIKNDIALRTGCFVSLASKKKASSTIAVVLRRNLRYVLGLKEIMKTPEFQKNSSPLLIAAGRDEVGDPLLIDLEKSNMFIFGTTGAGKTVLIDDIILSLIYRNTPSDLQLSLIDLKGVDLVFYNSLPHMRHPTVGDRSEAVKVLSDIVGEIERRRKLFFSNKVKTFEQYNALPGVTKLPYIVVVIDEYHDLVSYNPSVEEEYDEHTNDQINDVKNLVTKITSNDRTMGIRMIIATQQLVTEDISGTIQNNVNYRIRLSIYNNQHKQNDDKSVRNQKLLGSGDMQYERTSGLNGDEKSIIRGQACYVSADEIKRVVYDYSSKYKRIIQ